MEQLSTYGMHCKSVRCVIWLRDAGGEWLMLEIRSLYERLSFPFIQGDSSLRSVHTLFILNTNL